LFPLTLKRLLGGELEQFTTSAGHSGRGEPRVPSDAEAWGEEVEEGRGGGGGGGGGVGEGGGGGRGRRRCDERSDEQKVSFVG